LPVATPSGDPAVIGSGTTGSGGGPGGPGGPAATGGLDVTVGGAAPFGLIDFGVGTLGGLDWAVPAFAMGVPGLLLILAVLAQLSAGVVWLPIVRRWLGGFGVGRRRRRDGATTAEPAGGTVA
jgi:hypothetical protein